MTDTTTTAPPSTIDPATESLLQSLMGLLPASTGSSGTTDGGGTSIAPSEPLYTVATGSGAAPASGSPIGGLLLIGVALGGGVWYLHRKHLLPGEHHG